MTRVTRAHRSESDWNTLIQQQTSSGQSVRAFCKQKDIGCQSFYFWRKRIELAPDQTATSSMIDITSLVSVELPPQWHIELDLGGGIKLNLKQI